MIDAAIWVKRGRNNDRGDSLMHQGMKQGTKSEIIDTSNIQGNETMIIDHR